MAAVAGRLLRSGRRGRGRTGQALLRRGSGLTRCGLVVGVRRTAPTPHVVGRVTYPPPPLLFSIGVVSVPPISAATSHRFGAGPLGGAPGLVHLTVSWTASPPG